MTGGKAMRGIRIGILFSLSKPDSFLAAKIAAAMSKTRLRSR
jgi:hypothetical protein